MSAVNPIPQAASPARYIPTERGGFVDTGVIYLGANGTVEVIEWSEDPGRVRAVRRVAASQHLTLGL